MKAGFASGGAALLVIALVSSGCRRSDELFPLKIGNEWSYNVRTGLAQFVEPVKVSRSLSVAGAEGYELAGPMGSLRLGWKDKVLYATSLPNLRIAQDSPALPILVEARQKTERQWQGKIEFLGRFQSGSATLEQAPEQLKIAGKSYDTVRAKLLLKLPERSIELITWYARGIGPIRQEQRTNGTWDVGLDYLGGP